MTATHDRPKSLVLQGSEGGLLLAKRGPLHMPSVLLTLRMRHDCCDATTDKAASPATWQRGRVAAGGGRLAVHARRLPGARAALQLMQHHT